MRSTCPPARQCQGWPVRITTLNEVEYVWGGLSLYGTRLYVPVASYCDKPDPNGYMADGRIVGIDVVDAAIEVSFDTVDGLNNMGGVWGYAGTSIDQKTGHLWAATGNAWQYDPECGCIVETAGNAESVIELDADLVLQAANQPEDVDIVEDSGFGAAPLLFQPPGCPPLAAANAKNGKTYIWNRNALADGPFWSARVGPGELGASFVAQPSYSPAANTFVISAARDYDDEGTIRTFDAVVGFAIGPNCAIPERPTWTAPDVGRGPKSPPLIVDDLVFVPGGFERSLYALDSPPARPCGVSRCLAPCSRRSRSATTPCSSATASGNLHAYGFPRRPNRIGHQGLYAL